MRLPSAVAALSLLAACAFADVFGAAQAGDVRFVWLGDTVVDVGAAIPFQVVLEIDGARTGTPQVRVTVPDTRNITLAPTGDSIVGVRPGFGDVVAWVESSLAPRIDTVFRVRSRP